MTVCHKKMKLYTVVKIMKSFFYLARVFDFGVFENSSVVEKGGDRVVAGGQLTNLSLSAGHWSLQLVTIGHLMFTSKQPVYSTCTSIKPVNLAFSKVFIMSLLCH